MSSTKKKTTIPPWTRMDCSECGCDSEATRSEPKTITGDFVCSDCKLVEQATKGVEEDVYERVAAWYEAGCPVDRAWAKQANPVHLVRDYIAAGLPGWSPQDPPVAQSPSATKITVTSLINENSYLKRAILSTMGAGPDGQRVADAFRAAGDDGLEAVLEVAGIRMDASRFFGCFQTAMEEIIAGAAANLVTEKLGTAMDEVAQLHEDLVAKSRALFGAPKEEW